MSAIRDILASDPHDALENPPPSARPATPPQPPKPQIGSRPQSTNAREDEGAIETPKTDGAPADDNISPGEPAYPSTTSSVKRNASGSLSSVYPGNKMRHLKKEDGIPLWRKDIQYDFLRLVFFDQTKCFTKFSTGTTGCTFAEVYVDAMAKSSKCSKILKEKLLQDQEGAICMAMVCLLVNVGRMNTTLNFFPEMRAQLRTYHSIPALQARQDPNAYKQLQDAPRLKSILKGATEDDPQPSTIEDIKETKKPRTNAVNLIFVMSQYAPKISEVHFPPPRDFFDLVMKGSFSSASRARAFLWLMWWYMESDFTHKDSQRNPFGPGQYDDGEENHDGMLPLMVPDLESLTEEQAAAENVDTEEEKHFGEVKRNERIAILASEPSPAMTALKRARKEREKTGPAQGIHSDDEASEIGWSRPHTAVRLSGVNPETASEYTRSPSPATNRSFQATNLPKPTGEMQIHSLLNNNEDAASEASPPVPAPTGHKKGPGRGNWRRKKVKSETTIRPQEDRPHHVPLLPNTGQLSFVNEGPIMNIPAEVTDAASYTIEFSKAASPLTVLQQIRDHIPTPSYQVQKRHRGVTQHQSALINHRRQQVDYTLDRRIRRIHTQARRKREGEGSVLRAWKRLRLMPANYDSEAEAPTPRKAKDRAAAAATDTKDDEWRSPHGKGKENTDAASFEEGERWHLSRVSLAGFVRVAGEAPDVGEEAKVLAKAFRRCSRRVERWHDSDRPGQAMIERQRMRERQAISPGRESIIEHPDDMVGPAADEDLDLDLETPRKRAGRSSGGAKRRTNGKGRARPASTPHRTIDLRPTKLELDDDGGGELDEEDRELLGEVDADESEEDGDDEMGDG